MTRWEHKVLHLPIDIAVVARWLDAEGAQGWELVSYHRFMAPRRAHGKMMVEAVFKRPLVGEEHADLPAGEGDEAGKAIERPGDRLPGGHYHPDDDA